MDYRSRGVLPQFRPTPRPEGVALHYNYDEFLARVPTTPMDECVRLRTEAKYQDHVKGWEEWLGYEMENRHGRNLYRFEKGRLAGDPRYMPRHMAIRPNWNAGRPGAAGASTAAVRPNSNAGRPGAAGASAAAVRPNSNAGRPGAAFVTPRAGRTSATGTSAVAISAIRPNSDAGRPRAAGASAAAVRPNLSAGPPGAARVAAPRSGSTPATGDKAAARRGAGFSAARGSNRSSASTPASSDKAAPPSVRSNAARGSNLSSGSTGSHRSRGSIPATSDKAPPPSAGSNAARGSNRSSGFTPATSDNAARASAPSVTATRAFVPSSRRTSSSAARCGDSSSRKFCTSPEDDSRRRDSSAPGTAAAGGGIAADSSTAVTAVTAACPSKKTKKPEPRSMGSSTATPRTDSSTATDSFGADETEMNLEQFRHTFEEYYRQNPDMQELIREELEDAGSISTVEGPRSPVGAEDPSASSAARGSRIADSRARQRTIPNDQQESDSSDDESDDDRKVPARGKMPSFNGKQESNSSDDKEDDRKQAAVVSVPARPILNDTDDGKENDTSAARQAQTAGNKNSNRKMPPVASIPTQAVPNDQQELEDNRNMPARKEEGNDLDVDSAKVQTEADDNEEQLAAEDDEEEDEHQASTGKERGDDIEDNAQQVASANLGLQVEAPTEMEKLNTRVNGWMRRVKANYNAKTKSVQNKNKAKLRKTLETAKYYWPCQAEELKAGIETHVKEKTAQFLARAGEEGDLHKLRKKWRRDARKMRQNIRDTFAIVFKAVGTKDQSVEDPDAEAATATDQDMLANPNTVNQKRPAEAVDHPDTKPPTKKKRKRRKKTKRKPTYSLSVTPVGDDAIYGMAKQTSEEGRLSCLSHATYNVQKCLGMELPPYQDPSYEGRLDGNEAFARASGALESMGFLVSGNLRNTEPCKSQRLALQHGKERKLVLMLEFQLWNHFTRDYDDKTHMVTYDGPRGLIIDNDVVWKLQGEEDSNVENAKADARAIFEKVLGHDRKPKLHAAYSITKKERTI